MAPIPMGLINAPWHFGPQASMTKAKGCQAAMLGVLGLALRCLIKQRPFVPSGSVRE